MIAILSFILAAIIFVVIYILPSIGLIFTETNQKRWLGHWMVTVFAFYILVPVLSFILPKWIVQFIVISLGLFRLFTFRNEKVSLLLYV